MYKKVFSMALLFFATILLVIPQLGNTAESLKKTTDNNKFEVVITPPSEGFTVGTNDLALKISDSKGKGVTGAIISITPWMPGMGHGVMLKPSVKETGSGYYSAGNVGFSMPGQWQLIVTVNKKDLEDKATFEFASIGGGTVAKTGVVCNCGTGGNCPSGCLCGCQAGVTAAKCNMVDGKCQGNCSCGCKEGKPCQMKDGKCVGGCGCGCQSAGISNCKCGAGCTKLLNCNCGPDCKCPKDGKGGCGCKVGCATGCAKGGACPLPRPLGT